MTGLADTHGEDAADFAIDIRHFGVLIAIPAQVPSPLHPTEPVRIGLNVFGTTGPVEPSEPVPHSGVVDDKMHIRKKSSAAFLMSPG